MGAACICAPRIARFPKGVSDADSAGLSFSIGGCQQPITLMHSSSCNSLGWLSQAFSEASPRYHPFRYGLTLKATRGKRTCSLGKQRPTLSLRSALVATEAMERHAFDTLVLRMICKKKKKS